MIDRLSDYEILRDSKPKSFWLVVILYSIQVVLANIVDVWGIIAIGFSKYLELYKGYVLFWLLDISQIFIAIFFYRKSVLAWSLIPLVQSMIVARFTKNYYLDLNNYNGNKFEYFLADPLTLFFYVNSIFIVLLSYSPKLLQYLRIKSKVLTFVVLIDILIMILLIFAVNKIW